MGDAGVIADEDSGVAEPAGEMVEIIDTRGIFQRLFGAAEPVDRRGFGDSGGNSAEKVERSPFGRAAGEWMNDGEGAVGFGAGDAGKAGLGRGAEAAGLIQIEFDCMTGAGRQGG